MAERTAVRNHGSRALANVVHSSWKASSVWVWAIAIAASAAASSSGERNYRAEGDANSVRRALLIEDKIDAAFQPDQARRYKRRGELGVPELWSAYATCLVAPSAYIKVGHGFQFEAALEAISPLLSPDSLQRRLFKQKVIKNAIESQSLVGPKIEISKITEFRRRYYLAVP